MHRSWLLLGILAFVSAGCSGSPLTPGQSSASSPTTSTASTALTIRFLHEETTGVGQDVLTGGTVLITTGTEELVASVQSAAGWLQPRPLALPRDRTVHLVIDYPAWQAEHRGPQPAGRATIDLVLTGATMARYVVIPMAGPARDAGPIPGA